MIPRKEDKRIIRLMCMGDLHLGRTISSFPCGPLTAWQKIIDLALTHEVDALLLSGDIVDSDDQFFEFFYPLKEGIEKLMQKGIPVIVVAGNHDSALIKKLSLAIASENFHILGREGKWESKKLVLQGREIRFDGWSFPTAHFSSNPLMFYDLPPVRAGEIAIGLLHCDLLSASSEYAPVSRADFSHLLHRAWVLGHVHQHEVILERPLTFYCGSPQGLDPSERGEHGVHLLDLHPSSELVHHFVPIAALRWESVHLSLDGVKSEEWEIAIQNALKTAAVENAEAVGCRLILEGRCSFYRELDEKIALLGSNIAYVHKQCRYFIEKLENRAESDIDLNELARGSDLPALLAKKILALKSDDASLVNEAIAYFKKGIEENRLLCSEEIDELTVEESKELLLLVSMRLLDRLLAQRSVS
jgi:DNA repair protein SbcD/Mre11